MHDVDGYDNDPLPGGACLRADVRVVPVEWRIRRVEPEVCDGPRGETEEQPVHVVDIALGELVADHLAGSRGAAVVDRGAD